MPGLLIFTNKITGGWDLFLHGKQTGSDKFLFLPVLLRSKLSAIMIQMRRISHIVKKPYSKAYMNASAVFSFLTGYNIIEIMWLQQAAVPATDGRTVI